MSLFLFAEIQQFVNKFFELKAVFVYTFQLVVQIRAEGLHVQDDFHLTDYKCQRSSEFVRYVGKEAQFALRQFFDIIRMLLFVFEHLLQFDPVLVDPEQPEYGSRNA